MLDFTKAMEVNSNFAAMADGRFAPVEIGGNHRENIGKTWENSFKCGPRRMIGIDSVDEVVFDFLRGATTSRHTNGLGCQAQVESSMEKPW